MIRRSEIRAASAFCAALVGAGFASGREVESFFARLGTGSWLGVAAACAGLGFLVFVLLTLAQSTGASSFPDLYGRLMDTRCRDIMHLLHGLLVLMTAAAMIAAGGELGALALDLKGARLVGALFVLLAGLALAASGVCALGQMGFILTLGIAAIYAALAFAPGSSSFSGEGLMAAIPMGLLYASFNGALAGGVVVSAACEDVRPDRVGLLVALVMLLMLAPANAALTRCGERLRQTAMPTVVLAAQWGIPGYYAVIALMTVAVITTLGAMLSSLRDQAVSLGLPRTPALLVGTGLSVVMSACGFELLVNIVYPLLGWVCSFALLSLLFYWPDEREKAR